MAASWPWRTSSFASSTTCFWAPPKVSSLMTNSTRIGRLLVAESFGRTHPALAPHLEGEQVPELLRIEPVVAGAAVAEVGHGSFHARRIEEPALADAPGREVLVDERR